MSLRAGQLALVWLQHSRLAMLGLRSHRLTLVLQPSWWVALVLVGT